jgi:hypothetical protein
VPSTSFPEPQLLKRPQHGFARVTHDLGRQQATEPEDAGSLERVALFRGEVELWSRAISRSTGSQSYPADQTTRPFARSRTCSMFRADLSMCRVLRSTPYSRSTRREPGQTGGIRSVEMTSIPAAP